MIDLITAKYKNISYFGYQTTTVVAEMIHKFSDVQNRISKIGKQDTLGKCFCFEHEAEAFT